MYYLNTRYYDPNTKRFINADGYASTGHELNANNTYTYCLNNPIDKFDSFGTQPADLYPEYKTMDDAAIAAAEHIGELSFGRNFDKFKGNFYMEYFEYSICIYETTEDGKTKYYYDTDTVYTDYHDGHVKSPYVKEHYEYTPYEKQPVALVHTHPYTNKENIFIFDDVSNDDTGYAHRYNITMYAYTFTGNLYKYDQYTQKTTTVTSTLDVHMNYYICRKIFGDLSITRAMLE